MEFLINLMWDFQESKNITKMSIPNTQYLYDCININLPETKPRAKAVFCCALNSDTQLMRIIPHLAVEILKADTEEKTLMIDPSYETSSMDGIYCLTVYEMLNKIPEDSEISTREYIQEFIDLTKVAEKINNGERPSEDDIYYNEQADYVDANCVDAKLRQKN